MNNFFTFFLATLFAVGYFQSVNAGVCTNITGTCIKFNVKKEYCSNLKTECIKLRKAMYIQANTTDTIAITNPDYPKIDCRGIYNVCYQKGGSECEPFFDACFSVFYAKSEGRLN
jgi:hypothetical protein